MNVELQQRLFNPYQQTDHLVDFKQPQVSRNVSRTIKDDRRLKAAVLITLVTCYAFYRLFYSGFARDCITDLTHEWTNRMNLQMNQSREFYNWWVGIAQQVIELQILLLTVIATMRVHNLRVHLFISLFYSVRALFLNIQKLPYPAGMVWQAPAIPSFTVPYGISRDFFFSGHSGLMIISVVWWSRLGYHRLKMISLVMTVYVVLVLLATRVHYSIDIVGAVVFTLWMEVYIGRYVKYFDMFFSCIFEGMERIAGYMKQKLRV